MAAFEKQVNVQCGIGSISILISHTFIMQPTGPLQRTADKSPSKNLKFFFLENNRVQEGLIGKFIITFSTFLHNRNDFSSG